MSRKCCTLLLLLGTGVAARSQQTIGTGLPLPNGLHALAPPGFPLVFSNPACRDSGFIIATAVSRQHNLPGLGHRFAGLAFDAGHLRWSISVLQDGSRHFHRQQIGLSLANRIDKRTVIGFGLTADGIRQTHLYPERPELFVRAGLQTQLGRKTSLGMRLYSGFAKRNEASPPQTWHLAFGHAVSDKLRVMAELEAQSGTATGKASVKTALCYALNTRMGMMFGTGGRLRPYSFALSWKESRLQMALGFDYHGILGFTPQCIMVWKGKS
jgi:hypothetical protein